MNEAPAEREPKGHEYIVALPTFEGPLDLLLHLIQKHELDILDIPVSFVTQKYLEYLSLMEQLSIDIASEYLVMAATLAHIKSKSLLPVEPAGQEDEIEDEEADPRGELIRRLLEYQKYKQAAADLADRGALGRDVFLRGSPAPEVDGPAPLAPVPLWDLLDAFGKVVARAKIDVEHEISFDRLSITDRIMQLCDRLAGRASCTFEDLFEGQRTRFDLIITFLALLEMARLKMARLYQPDPLAPIFIELSTSERSSRAGTNGASSGGNGIDAGAAAGPGAAEAAAAASPSESAEVASSSESVAELDGLDIEVLGIGADDEGEILTDFAAAEPEDLGIGGAEPEGFDVAGGEGAKSASAEGADVRDELSALSETHAAIATEAGEPSSEVDAQPVIVGSPMIDIDAEPSLEPVLAGQAAAELSVVSEEPVAEELAAIEAAAVAREAEVEAESAPEPSVGVALREIGAVAAASDLAAASETVVAHGSESEVAADSALESAAADVAAGRALEREVAAERALESAAADVAAESAAADVAAESAAADVAAERAAADVAAESAAADVAAESAAADVAADRAIVVDPIIAVGEQPVIVHDASVEVVAEPAAPRELVEPVAPSDVADLSTPVGPSAPVASLASAEPADPLAPLEPAASLEATASSAPEVDAALLEREPSAELEIFVAPPEPVAPYALEREPPVEPASLLTPFDPTPPAEPEIPTAVTSPEIPVEPELAPAPRERAAEIEPAREEGTANLVSQEEDEERRQGAKE